MHGDPSGAESQSVLTSRYLIEIPSKTSAPSLGHAASTSSIGGAMASDGKMGSGTMSVYCASRSTETIIVSSEVRLRTK